MKLSVIKHNDNETVFYNPAIFQEGEDLIIFPFKEFDKFYNDTIQSLNVIKNMIKDSLNSGSAINPQTDLEHIEDWINLISEDMDFLIKFNTQTTLSSFKNVNTRKSKNKINVPSKQIQCLIGL